MLKFYHQNDIVPIKCAVCFTVISFPYEHNKCPKQDYHYHDVCKQHETYANVFLIDLIAENLGFKDREVHRHCALCKKEISLLEAQNSLQQKSFHYLCSGHLSHSKKFMLPNR